MSGILTPHSRLQRGGILRSTGVLIRSGVIRRDHPADPLERIPFRLRLQTHRGEQEESLAGINIRGAGSEEYSGFYDFSGFSNGRPMFAKSDGRIMTWEPTWGPPSWLIWKPGDSHGYTNSSDSPLPSNTGWIPAGGGFPAPVVAVVNGIKKPLGLYQNVDCTIPATKPGDLIAAWRDEISGSGLVLTQSVSSNRPILRFVSGVPVLKFDGVDDFLITTGVPTIAGIISTAVTGMYDNSVQSNGRLLSMADSSNMDWEGSTGFVPVFRPLSGSNIGVQYTTPLGHQEILPYEWFTFASRATGSAIDTWKNGSGKSTVSVDTSAIAATRLKIGGAFAYSDTDDLWGGYISNVAFGPWTEDQTLQVQDHFKDLSPDPLSGVPTTLRLQTHRGDGVPLGLYKDTSCTIPATSDGDSIAAWRDEISGSGLTAVQSVTTRRPTLRFVSGKPVVRFDGVDDILHTTVPAPAGKFSYAASGRYRNAGNYAALVGAPLGGVTFGGSAGTNFVGINKLGTNGPQTPVDVGTSAFAFVVTYQPNIYSYHVRRPGVADVVLADQADGSGGYATSGSLTIGNGHSEDVPATVDLTAILILTGERWTAGQMERAVVHLHSLDAAPLP